jgi:polyisoprenoid-binding protein YceI
MRPELLILSALIHWLPAPAVWPADAPPVPLPHVLAADSFRIDPSHTHVGFGVRHLGIATVRGEFKEISALLLFEPSDPTRSQVEVRIKSASLTTGNERRDTDLKTNFLDVASHPEITFVSERIERDANGYRAIGKLTLNGVTRAVTLPFEFTGPVPAPGNLLRIGVSGQLQIDRRDYGVALQRMADNALVVGNEVRITLDVEFGRRAAPAAGGATR